MLKRRFVLVFFVFCLLTLPLTAFAATSSRIDVQELENGVVVVQGNKHKVIEKVGISKGNQQYFYNLNTNNVFPLQFGDGNYTIAIYENVTGNKYRLVENKEVTVKTANEHDVFLQPIQMIYWTEEMKAIAKARELTKNLKTDKEKVEAIYNFVINHVSYDYDKAKNIANDYIPVIDQTLTDKQGICYDYAALLAAMLRSEGIPTKLIMGKSKAIPDYHAWNEVYLKDTKEWVTIDTTYDAVMVKSKKEPIMIKDKRDYTTEKFY